MKVTCEYCNSYVEADENLKCPNCQAPLGDAVKAEEARIKAEEEAQRQKEAEEAEKQAQKDAVSNTLKGIAGVAGAIFGTNRMRQTHPERPPLDMPRDREQDFRREPTRRDDRHAPRPDDRHDRHTDGPRMDDRRHDRRPDGPPRHR